MPNILIVSLLALCIALPPTAVGAPQKSCTPRWLKFSLRTLLAVGITAAVGSGIYGNRKRRQEETDAWVPLANFQPNSLQLTTDEEYRKKESRSLALRSIRDPVRLKVLRRLVESNPALSDLAQKLDVNWVDLESVARIAKDAPKPNKPKDESAAQKAADLFIKSESDSDYLEYTQLDELKKIASLYEKLISGKASKDVTLVAADTDLERLRNLQVARDEGHFGGAPSLIPDLVGWCEKNKADPRELLEELQASSIPPEMDVETFETVLLRMSDEFDPIHITRRAPEQSLGRALDFIRRRSDGSKLRFYPDVFEELKDRVDRNKKR